MNEYITPGCWSSEINGMIPESEYNPVTNVANIIYGNGYNNASEQRDSTEELVEAISGLLSLKWLDLFF